MALWIVPTLIVAGVLAFAALGWWSNNGASSGAGMAAGTTSVLPPCGGAPNCVCSENRDSPAYIEPISLPSGDRTDQWQQIRQAVVDLNGVIIEERGDYLRATLTSGMFRFVDDLELRLGDSTVHVRSASRVGYSDMGINTKRVESLRTMLADRL